MKKKIAIAVLTIATITIIGLIFMGNYFYDLAVNSKTSKDFLFDSEHLGPADTSGNLSSEADSKKLALEWAEKHYTQYTIESFDNLKLNGYYFDNQKASHKYIIVVHGYMGKALDMIFSIKRFYKEGYSVLAPDCRGSGESEGDYIGMGWDDRLDILKWIDLIVTNDPEAEIVLYGVSMGGATVMMVSGEESLPSNVKSIVEDCGYTSASDIFTYQLKDLFNLPKFPIIPAASLVTKVRAGYYLEEASALKQVAKSKTPIYFIHGDKDEFVPFSMLDTLYKAANSPKEKYVVKGAGHGFASSVDGDTYWDNVFHFINKYMN